MQTPESQSRRYRILCHTGQWSLRRLACVRFIDGPTWSHVLVNLLTPLGRNCRLLVVALVNTTMYSDRDADGYANNGTNDQEGYNYLD